MLSSSQPTHRFPPASRREILAWAFYDFANSGYTTVVLTAIYSAYFVGVIAAGLEQQSPGIATLLWTLAIGTANLMVLISGPIVGAIADYRASKKLFLLISSILCVSATALLSAAAPGNVGLVMLLLTISAIAFASGENLIGAFLPEIADSERLGRISGFGWSLGYFGGLLTLGICLLYMNRAMAIQLGPEHYVPVALLITATIFAVTAAPTFIWLKERATPKALPSGMNYLQAGYAQVYKTLTHATKLPDLFRFLICLTLFQAGVATVVVIAAIYAQEVLHFGPQQLILLIMVVNFTAAIGAFGFGFAQDHWGSVPSLVCALLVWIAAGLVTYQADQARDLWLAGNLMGLAMGATQAGGRALIGKLTPPARNAEIFGLWGLANRAAAIIGPVSYGVINSLAGGDHRASLLSTLLFFVAGMLLLLTVNEARGHRVALLPENA